MGGAYVTHARGQKIYKILVENPKEKDHSKDQGVDGRTGSRWIIGRLAGGVEWIFLAEDRDRWRAVVNTVMDLRVLVPRS
jgi:hypothetical protein